MLPKKHRLPLRHQRHSTQSQARAYSSPLLTLLIAHPQNRRHSPTRFATLISKKVSNLAITRNRKRRQLLNAAHQLLPSLSSGLDIIIIPKKSILTADFKSIKQSLQTALAKFNASCD